MLDILSITGPIYVLIAIGYLAVRSGLMRADDSKVLSTFVLYFALPALLFKIVSTRSPGEIFNLSYLATYLTGSLVLLLIAYVFLTRFRGLDHERAAMDTMGMVCPNSGFVGYPIGLLLFPSIAGPVLALNMMVENFVIIPLLLTLAAPRSGSGAIGVLGGAILRTLKMPLIIALALGLAVSLLQIKLPELVMRPVSILGDASVPLSLFIIGASLSGLPLKGEGTRILTIVTGKLFAHPLVMLAALSVVPVLLSAPLEDTFHNALLLTAALPMMGIYTLFAARHRSGPTSAAAMVTACVLSFFTLSGLVYYFSIS